MIFVVLVVILFIGIVMNLDIFIPSNAGTSMDKSIQININNKTDNKLNKTPNKTDCGKPPGLYNEVEDVPLICQHPELPTGCESTCAAMLLQWAGVDIQKEAIAKALQKGDIPKECKGKLYGSNPNEVFVGNPFEDTGYGVYHKPIADVMKKYCPGQINDVTGISFQELFAIIDSGRPVIVWATINMKTPSISKTWFDEKGNEVVWRIPQHALVLVGYTKSDVITNDPTTGTKMLYDKAQFKLCWQAMGSQAITIKKQKN